MKTWLETIKNFRQQYRGFSVVVLLEFVWLMVLIVASLGKRAVYELDYHNFIIKDPEVVTDENGVMSVTGRNDEEAFGRWIITSDKLDIPHGMYEMDVNYCSMLHDMDNGGGNCEDATGAVQLISENHASAFQYNEIRLEDGRTSISDRVWIRSLTGIDDMEVKVTFYGLGDLQLTSIVIKELPVWRFVCIAGWLLAFVTLDVFYLYFFTKNSYQDKQVVLGLLATIIFSSLPLFTDFLFDGHDIKFHLARIFALAEGIQNGHWIVPIQTEMVNRYGYAAPLFYGQLFLYIPAVLYTLAVPLQLCYQIYAILVNVATCLICYYCIKGLLKDKNLAVLGAFLYTLSAYRMMCLYVRAAVGEYTAMAFFPLILYGFAKVYMEEGKKMRGGVLAIIAGLSGVVYSHMLSGELTALFIMIFCIIYIRKTLQPKRLLALVCAAALTVVVTLAFTVPFLHSSMQMDLSIEHSNNDIRDSGIYLMQALGMFMQSAGSDQPAMHHDIPVTMGFSLAAGLGIFMLCCAKKYDWKIEGNQNLQVGVICSGFTIVCIIFSTKFFLWDSMKDISAGLSKVLSVVQFPWRYLSIGTVMCLTASVIGVKLLGECKGVFYRKIAAGILIAFALLNTGHFYMEFGYSTAPVYAYGFVAHHDGLAGGEYLPAGMHEHMFGTLWRKVATDENFVTVDQYDYTDGITTLWCKNSSDEEKTVEIPLITYANYHAYAVEDGTELEIRNGENDFVNIVIPAGYEGTVQVLYQIPWLWKLSYILSAITAVSISMSALYHYFRQRRQVSV